MRVLFTCHSAVPHLYPMVPLVWAFHAAGHEVRIAGQSRILGQVLRTGMPAVELTGSPQWTDEELRETVTAIYSQGPWPDDWPLHMTGLRPAQRDYLELLGGRMARAAEAVVDELAAFAREWRPDMIVYDAAALAGPVVADLVDVPGVRYLFGTATVPRLEIGRTGTPIPEYSRLFTDRGLPASVTPAITVDPTPPSLRLDTSPCLSMRYVPYNGPGVVPHWIREHRKPRVCVTWGHTSAQALGKQAAQPYWDAIAEIASLNVDIIVATTPEQAALAADLPARVVVGTPLHLILPHCDVLVQQGGDGTTLTAAALGVPQLAISRKPDAEIAPGRIVAAGAGIHLRYQELRDFTDVRFAVTELLTDPAYALAARRLADEIERQPSPVEVVHHLEMW